MRKVIFFLLPVLLLCGCASDWYQSPERITVKDSGLNWVQIYYQATSQSPRIRCDLRDRGSVTVLEGKSVTVGDDFNIDYQNKDFQDVQKYQYQMSPDDFVTTLQALVNSNLLEREKNTKEDEAKLEKDEIAKVLVRANINHCRIDKFTFDRDLILEIEMQLFRYKRSGRVR
ncbi:MAG: hypothetical protein RSD41_00285 [Kiritimatiellia bacterium]